MSGGLHEWLAKWLSSGHALDLILAIVAVELVLIQIWFNRQGRRLALTELIGPVGAGIFLMLALRTALVGGAPELIAVFLIASLPAHLYDLRLRFSRAQAPP